MANAIAMIAACMIRQDPSIPLHYERTTAGQAPEAPTSGQHVTRDSEDVVVGFDPLIDEGAFWTA